MVIQGKRLVDGEGHDLDPAQWSVVPVGASKFSVWNHIRGIEGVALYVNLRREGRFRFFDREGRESMNTGTFMSCANKCLNFSLFRYMAIKHQANFLDTWSYGALCIEDGYGEVIMRAMRERFQRTEGEKFLAVLLGLPGYDMFSHVDYNHEGDVVHPDYDSILQLAEPTPFFHKILKEDPDVFAELCHVNHELTSMYYCKFPHRLCQDTRVTGLEILVTCDQNLTSRSVTRELLEAGIINIRTRNSFGESLLFNAFYGMMASGNNLHRQDRPGRDIMLEGSFSGRNRIRETTGCFFPMDIKIFMNKIKYFVHFLLQYFYAQSMPPRDQNSKYMEIMYQHIPSPALREREHEKSFLDFLDEVVDVFFQRMDTPPFPVPYQRFLRRNIKTFKFVIRVVREKTMHLAVTFALDQESRFMRYIPQSILGKKRT
jgi:hypothetical protein